MLSCDVVIPVGPYANDQRWLPECLQSIARQTHAPARVMIIDDMAGLDTSILDANLGGVPYTVVRNPWRIGCADSWNVGIALGPSELAFMMGADDTLEPTCLAECLAVYVNPYRYYHVTVRYCTEQGEPTEEVQGLACNAAMVSKTLWRHIGGFPPEAGLGAPDALLISVMLGRGPEAGTLYHVAPRKALYNVRRHPGQETGRTGKYHGAIIDVRNVYTSTWQPVKWGR